MTYDEWKAHEPYAYGETDEPEDDEGAPVPDAPEVTRLHRTRYDDGYYWRECSKACEADCQRYEHLSVVPLAALAALRTEAACLRGRVFSLTADLFERDAELEQARKEIEDQKTEIGLRFNEKCDLIHQLEAAQSRDSIKTSEINILTKENREQAAALEQARKDLEDLRHAINDSDLPCDQGCDSYGHTDTCKHVDPAAWLVTQQHELEQARKEIEELTNALRYVSTALDKSVTESLAQLEEAQAHIKRLEEIIVKQAVKP